MSKANKIRVVQRTSQRINNMSAYDIRKQSSLKKKKKEACVNGGPAFNGYQVLNDIIGKIGESYTFAEPMKIEKRKKKCKKSGI